MKFQLSIIQFPNGRFGFVGSVPRDLAIRHLDGRTLSDDEFKMYATASNPAMIKKLLSLIEPTFNTRTEAIEFVKDTEKLNLKMKGNSSFGQVMAMQNLIERELGGDK